MSCTSPSLVGTLLKCSYSNKTGQIVFFFFIVNKDIIISCHLNHFSYNNMFCSYNPREEHLEYFEYCIHYDESWCSLGSRGAVERVVTFATKRFTVLRIPNCLRKAQQVVYSMISATPSEQLGETLIFHVPQCFGRKLAVTF